MSKGVNENDTETMFVTAQICQKSLIVFVVIQVVLEFDQLIVAYLCVKIVYET